MMSGMYLGPGVVGKARYDGGLKGGELHMHSRHARNPQASCLGRLAFCQYSVYLTRVTAHWRAEILQSPCGFLMMETLVVDDHLWWCTAGEVRWADAG
jgi:hypothetical protein